MGTSGSSKTKALWSGAITVAVLAVVLIVFGMVGPLFKGADKVTVPPNAQQPPAGDALYSQAVAADVAGDTTKSAQLAQAALDADPSNAAAKTLLDKASKPPVVATTPPPSGPGSSATRTVAPKPDDTVFLAKVANLASLLPSAYPGFEIGPAVQGGGDVTASGMPPTTTGPVENLLWAVHDRKTAAGAKKFVAQVSKKAYSHNAKTVTVNGIKTYFGTDGTRFATLSFSRGRYAFEVLAAARGVTPSKLKSTVVGAAKAFPTAPPQ